MVNPLEYFEWLIVSAAIGLPFIGSLYVLLTPTHKLMENWQNYKMRRTRRVLKDHHFKHIPRRIYWCKVLSVVVIAFCLWALMSLVGSLGHVNLVPYSGN